MAGDTTVEFVRLCRHCGQALSATATFCSKCGATASLPGADADATREKLRDLFGTELDIERELGRGGMAVVYAGFDPALQRRVAVKVLLPEIANDRSSADRFLREARTVAALQHPHVVTVYTVRSRDDVHAIVMQYVEGRSLDAVLHEKGAIPVHVAGMLLSQAASGLQHAHDRGVIHRDVKPANVLIDADGRAIVSDFGIARRDTGPRTTDTGLVVGTWAYMSPEQRAGDSILPATDQYALGVMAFELLTGRLPFTGTAGEILRAHMHDPPPSLRAIRPEVPAAVEALVHRMLAKVPDERWPSLKEAEHGFRKLVPDEGKTTLQLAAFSKVAPRGGSSVIVAATRPPKVGLAAAPTERVDKGAAVAEPVVAPAPAKGAARKGAVPMMVAGVAVLAAVGSWAMWGRGGAAGQERAPAPSPTETQTPPVQNPVAEPATVPSAPRGGATTVAQAPTIGTTKIDTTPRVATPPAEPVTAPAPRVEPPPVAAPTAASATSPAAAAMPASTLADARRLGREFVTMLNQRRYRELQAVPQVGGDAALRAELIKLTETAGDFAAGFDRVASAPSEWSKGFETEFFVDLEWRGGRKVLRIRLYASPSEGGWRLAGFGVDPAN